VREVPTSSTPKGGRPPRRWEVNPLLNYCPAETAQTAQTLPLAAVSAVCAAPTVFAQHSDPEPWEALDIPDSLRRAPREVAPDRRLALGPVGDSLDDFR
jgi:hypothetical protein